MNKKTWLIWFICLYILSMTIYAVYCFNSRGLKIEFTEKYQQNYAEYLISKNDSMIDSMLEFSTLSNVTDEPLTDEKKEKLKANIITKNDILKHLQTNPPNVDNTAYDALYKDILKTYAFYIQGDIMKAEYLYAYKDSYTKEELEANLNAQTETFIMGASITNEMANIILDLPAIINSINKTDYKSKHKITEMKKQEVPASSSSSNQDSIIQEWNYE